MCVVSMISDYYKDRWHEKDWWLPTHPETIPYPGNPGLPNETTWPIPQPVTQEQFDELKREVMELKELLKRAKKYDEDNNEPDCEMDSKTELLKKIAELVGVDLDLKNL